MRRLFSFLTAFIILTAASCGGADDASGSTGVNLRIESRQQGPYRLELSYPAGDVEFGTTAELVLQLEYPEGEEFVLSPPEVDGEERYSNTIIVGISEGETILSGNGTAVSTISFRLEAWLPGEIVFPPLTIRFSEEFTTDEAIIKVVSSFDEEDSERVLSPLYTPVGERSIPWAPLAAVILLISGAAVVIVFLRCRRKAEKPTASGMTREELIEEFRLRFIDTEDEIDLRAAFTEIARIPGADIDKQYLRILDEARFSKEGIECEDGLSILRQIFSKLTAETGGEGDDEL